MDRKNDNEKIIEDAISGTTEDGGNVENTVDLFELAAKSGETSYTPAPEDIFVIGEPETDTVSYPEVFAEDDEIFLPESEDDHEVFLSESEKDDKEKALESEDDDDHSDDENDEEYSDEDDEDEEYSEENDDEEEYYDEDDEDVDYSDEDEEYSEENDDEEEYSDEDDEDEEYSDEDDEDEEYSDEDDEDEDYSDHEYEEYKEYDYGSIPDDFTDYPDDDGEDVTSGDDYDEEFDDDYDYDEEPSDSEDEEEYSDDDEDDDGYDNGYDNVFSGSYDGADLPEGVIGDAEWLKDEDGSPLANDHFEETESDEIPEEEEGEDLFAMAANAADLPETEKHGALYYWAKRKTVAGWIKFGLKCVAAVLLIIVASGVLYFNGLLNLIDYRAADDFEMYDSISESDFDEDEGPVYSNPESYIETTTIEGFNESMIDIPKKDVLNILLIGTDVRGGTYDERGNTDSMILISVNTRDKTIKLTSFMRDMYVYIPNRQWARLNVAYAYGGPQLLFDTLKNNFDVDVDLYVRVNFANFRKIVNHVGGVEIELTEAEAKYMNDNSEKYKTKPVEPGMQHLDGAQALSYARCRKIDSDFNRTKRQRTVIIALVDKIKHSSPGELNTLLNVFLPMIQTNMSKMQILGLMVDGTKYLNNEIETLNVPIKNSWRSELINKRSVLCPNFELNKTAIVAHVYSTYHLDVEKTKYQGFSIPNS